jgi:hypothetical protein
MSDSNVENKSEQGAAPGVTEYLVRTLGSLDAAFILAGATGALFACGWIYLKSYYQAFGVDHAAIGLPFHAYLIAPLDAYFLPVAMVVVCAVGVTYLQQADTYYRGQLSQFVPGRWFNLSANVVNLSSLVIIYSVCLLMTWRSYLFEMIVVLAISNVLATPWLRSCFPRFVIRLRTLSYAVMTFAGLIVLMHVMGAASARRGSLLTSPEIPTARVVITDPVLEKAFPATDPVKVLFTSEEQYWIFMPRDFEAEPMPPVVCIPRAVVARTVYVPFGTKPFDKKK